MKIKVCFNEEIHRVSNVPATLDGLIQLIPTIFHSQLPENWTLQYKDSDGDNILMSDEKDFEEFKNTEHGAIAKIFIVSDNSFKAPQSGNSDTSMIMSNLKREEDYQVIEDEENKPEEKIQIQEEEPEPVQPKEPEIAPEVNKYSVREEITEKPEETEKPTQDGEPEKAEDKVDEEPRGAEPEEEVERKEEPKEDVAEEREVSEKSEKEEETAPEEKEEPKVQEVVDYSKILGAPKEVRGIEEVFEERREPKMVESVEYSKILGAPQEKKEEIPEPEKLEPVEEKPVVEREEEEKEQKEPFNMEYSNIEPVRKEKLNDLLGMMSNKASIDMDVLKNLVSSMIEQKLPEIAQYTQNQIEESRSMNQSMLEQSILLNDDLPKKPAAPKVVHYETRCVGCGMSPIVGVRYKCTICHNFDYCEQCEDAGTHPHNFIKIRQRDVLDIFKPPQKPVVKPAEWKKPEPVPEFFPKPVIEKKVPKEDPKFYDNLIEKAKKLQKCFPKEDFDMLCVYISDAPADLSMEELVENYKYGMKNK